MENFSKSGEKFFQIMYIWFQKIKLGNWSIKLEIVIITIISTSNIISSSSFTLVVPREQRNFFATTYVLNFFVTRYVQVLFDLNSKKQTQFTVALAFGL